VNRAHLDTSTQEPVIDGMVKHLAYDGLGRLVRVQSPFPSVETAQGRVRSEWFFYDGVRRIEEVVTDPLVSLEFADGGGGSTELGDAASEYGPDYDADPSAANMAFEQALTDDLLTFPDEVLAETRQWLAREYVWGPGDGPAGVDELLAQYAGGWGWDRGKPWWVLQDGGGDVAALWPTTG
jgi:hypothetical protein